MSNESAPLIQIDCAPFVQSDSMPHDIMAAILCFYDETLSWPQFCFVCFGVFFFKIAEYVESYISLSAVENQLDYLVTSAKNTDCVKKNPKLPPKTIFFLTRRV